MAAPPPQLLLPVSALRDVADSSAALVSVARELAGIAASIEDPVLRKRLENQVSIMLDHVDRLSTVVRLAA